MKNTIMILLFMFSASVYASIDDSTNETSQLEITENDEQVHAKVCIPDNLTASQASSIVAEYIRDNPDIQNSNEIAVASNALIYAFPCGDT